MLTSTAPAGWYKVGSNIYVTNSSGVVTSITTCVVTYTLTYDVGIYTNTGGSWSIYNSTTSTSVASGSGNQYSWTGSFSADAGDTIVVTVSDSGVYPTVEIAVDSNLETSNSGVTSATTTYSFTVTAAHAINGYGYDYT